MAKLSVDEYFRMPESLRPMELVWGRVREPPAPRYGHQSVVTTLAALLYRHVSDHGLGQVCVSPIDVVLDHEKALVVQPDIVFVAAPHLDRIRERIWGPPDLVVEVVSRGTARRDRTTKLAWYAHYGVTECWVVDPLYHFVEVVDLQRQPPVWVRYEGDLAVRSRVLTQWDMTADAIFS